MRKHLHFILVVIFTIMTVFYFIKKEPVQQSITFFPLDENVSFINAKTRLSLTSQKDDDEFSIKWAVNSLLDQNAYLRQDISLLYEDGYLCATLGKWQQEESKLEEKKRINSEDSSHFEAISFHHAEIHYDNDVIKSKQVLTNDHLYVIDSPLSPLKAFKQAQTTSEKEWKQILDHAKNQHMKVVWERLIKYYQIPIKEYTQIPLTTLSNYSDKPLPGMTRDESDVAIGKLWEGLYKNYFLGIRLKDGTTISPEGSSIPLILIDQEATHLLVIFQASTGEPIQLLQYL